LIKSVLKKTVEVILVKTGQKALTSPSKSTSNQPFTSQASNNLQFQAWAKFKSNHLKHLKFLVKTSTNNTQKCYF